MNILDKIVVQKQKEVAERKARVSVAELEKGKFFASETLSLKSFLADPARTGIIAEFKRKSPSKGIINDRVTVEEVTGAYAKYGASGISVLTDQEFFGGSLDDLLAATINEVPLLRKDFMIDEYQLIEAKAYGAEVILLIAACLTPVQVKTMAATAKGLGLEVLLEIHNEEELGHVCDAVDLVGVNNRNLKTFEVNIDTSLGLIHKIPKEKPAVAESGISDVDTIVTLRQAGFSGFLIGENFMKQASPSVAFADFVNQLKAK
ncbi:MAG: indole-3-glycerol phosphate synthase TrpC [Chitinophagaceae bacterium]|nr:indole-3-glycerol phosphate synthase TrpC [Chitinophagaceae bacterium]MCA6453260.1 indole-3-glycerol phosphate synthase TrpC [Chitinophagaceae bacterium]MCA6454495.1 indole-3-glycerol phosphate synthase TrpC [Chitinophagaceae bacterium]MCA6459234.1 indole-3-glycerol phosphate synthase TrpC [Chitinophagaceae bacterium]MCA6464604.1 indole-3-glycerol phosphate synthase TrpC [Chitinophagaceae bacterium]